MSQRLVTEKASFVGGSVVGNVPTSCQKYPASSPQTRLENVLTSRGNNHTYKCGNTVSNSGHWPGSAFTAMPPSPQPRRHEIYIIH